MKKTYLLIKGGTVIDPSQKINCICDVLISDGKIESVGKDITASGAEVINAVGMLVMPGLIDMHVHLREPGNEEAETILSGCEAAARGGFTAVCAMPNTNPATDDAGRVQFIVERAAHAKARVYPIGAITRGRRGEEITEMGDMKRAGAVGFSDDGTSVNNAAVMINALRYADMVGGIILGHEEDLELDRDGQMNDGALSAELGLKGMPGIAEEIMIQRDIALAEYTGTPIHMTHISTRGSMEIIRDAKKRGVSVTCDVTPHHLTLTEDLVATFDTRYKMSPPLRAVDDVKAMCEGLSDGTIDAIATDHAPHSPENKENEFIHSAFGVTGLETALGVVHRELVAKDILTWGDLVTVMSLNPSRIVGLQGGTLREGSVGDVTIYNPEASWVVDPGAMKSRSKNTAFFGWRLPGSVVATIVGGVIHRNEA